jgi:hypothetical protein
MTQRFCWYVVLLLLLAFFNSCKHHQLTKTERGFYYWKSKLALRQTEQTALAELNVKKLYVKLFDVVASADGSGGEPVARLQTDSNAARFLLEQQIQITPVVFITNETLQRADTAQIGQLAENILRLTNVLCADLRQISFGELQIDCDWTQSTKQAYFLLLQTIKAGLKEYPRLQACSLSATIRLHQVRYYSRTGVPPADKGLLMCYNMGNLKNPATKNSILNPDELKSYLVQMQQYPLQLDLALPLFDWMVLFRNNLYKGVISSIKSNQLTSASGTWTENRFRFEKDTTIQFISFREGDVVRLEESSKEDLEECIRFLKKRISRPETTISFYHLDSTIISKHPIHELETYYRQFAP